MSWGFSGLKSTLTLGLSIYNFLKKNYLHLHGFHGIQHYICCLYLVYLVLHIYIIVYVYIYSCIPTKSLVRNPLPKHRDSQTVWMELLKTWAISTPSNWWYNWSTLGQHQTSKNHGLRQWWFPTWTKSAVFKTSLQISINVI